MVTSAELNTLTVKKLGSLAKDLSIAGWHEMRKDELVRILVAKSRSRAGSELFQKIFRSRAGKTKQTKETGTIKIKKINGKVIKTSDSKKVSESYLNPSIKKRISSKPAKTIVKKEGKKRLHLHSDKENKKSVEKENRRLKNNVIKENLCSISEKGHEDRLILLVRDPYWLHAYWELNTKTIERAKVAMGHFWYTASPVIRLFRLETDHVAQPKRQLVRDVTIHGGVNNWYLDVTDPPSGFQAELGFLSREKKFYSVVSSNIVQTPQRQIVDDLDKLDGNWKGVADDLGRIYKLSGGDSGNTELRQVFEEQLKRSMSAPMLSRYRVSQNGVSGEKTRRNFHFEIDADVIIHGKTDPSVQVTIRNEPIKLNADGTFSVRFAIPEKRHVFPIEAEGSDGVEMQRVILTMERNTRILETLFQEHIEED